MDNYCKGKNVEEELDRNKIDIPNLPDDFLWMQVKGGSKIGNLVIFAQQKFPKEHKCVVWSGSGAAVSKTISCVEILKRKLGMVHQFTRICYRKVDEYWTPKLPELDEIVVSRNIPTIHIQLSVDVLNEKEPGYQIFEGRRSNLTNMSKSRKRSQLPNTSRVKLDKEQSPTEEFAALGVKDNKRKRPKPQSKIQNKTDLKENRI